MNQRKLIAGGICSLAVFTPLFFGAYQYYYTDTLTSVNLTYWWQNGSLTASSGGLTALTANGGSLISKVAVPDGSSEYEVKTTLTLTASGGDLHPLPAGDERRDVRASGAGNVLFD